MKAFGDMGPTARLLLIRDRFIADHGSCVPRPIRDVLDRCRVWESHTDPAVRRVSKPCPDPIYPAYVVGDSDNISKTTLVAAVTGPKSGPDQLEVLLRRLLMAVDTQAPIPEVPAVEKLLQRLVAETQTDGIGTELSVSHVGSQGMLRLGARLWMSRFRLCCRDGRRTATDPATDPGFASRFSGNVRPQDPGGGAMPIVAPRRMTNNDVSNTPELSGGGGGGAQLVPSRVSVVLVEETNAGDTSGRECLCKDQ